MSGKCARSIRLDLNRNPVGEPSEHGSACCALEAAGYATFLPAPLSAFSSLALPQECTPSHLR
jgi:hypothetical protein